jgi:DNA-binding response OmpR family regulator
VLEVLSTFAAELVEVGDSRAIEQALVQNVSALALGPAHGEDVPYLRVFIGQLRQKIELNPAAPDFIRTEPGIGYRWMPDDGQIPAQFCALTVRSSAANVTAR